MANQTMPLVVGYRGSLRTTDDLQIIRNPVRMTVDSYLELYTTMFGWMFYGVVWDILVATGIVYLPFLGILIDQWRQAAADNDYSIASGLSLRRIEMEMLFALIVVVFAGQPVPLTPIVATTLQYTPPPTLNNPSPSSVSYANSQSTFGDSGFTGSDATVNVPMWWYSILAFSSGFNHAIVEGLPRSSELRHVIQLSRLATMEDPRLRSEVSAFYSSCYVPARSKYLRERPSTAAVNNLIIAQGEGDTDWIGSHVYRETTGYYDTYRATAPVEGWNYDVTRDTEYAPATPPTSGRPHCREWWLDSGIGLRQKLIDAADRTAPGLAALVHRLAPALLTDRQRDIIARTVLHHAPRTWSNNSLALGNRATEGSLGKVEGLAKEAVYMTGALISTAIFSAIVTGLLAIAPMAQAIVLMAIYSLLPLIVVFSRYAFSIMITGGLAIFSVKFWTVLWYLAQWIDQNLIASMYPDVNLFFEFLTNSTEQTNKRLLLNFVTTCLYIGLPLLWSAMIAWTGARVGRSIDAAMNPYSSHASESGRMGARARIR